MSGVGRPYSFLDVVERLADKAGGGAGDDTIVDVVGHVEETQETPTLTESATARTQPASLGWGQTTWGSAQFS